MVNEKMCKCKRCGMKLTNKKSIELGYGATCFRIIQLNNQETKPEQIENLDMNEIKSFITSEIENALKSFNFNRPNNDKSENIGIVSTKVKKMPKFNILNIN